MAVEGGTRGRGVPAALRWLLVVLVGAGAAVGAVSAWGGPQQSFGPLRADVGLAVSWGGGTRIAVPPLGAVDLATHGGPLQVRATVTEVRPEQARQLLRQPRPARALADTVAEEAREAVVRGALASAAVALAAAVLVCAVVFRRRRETAVGGLAVLGLLMACGAAAAATVRPEALAEPRFSGPLAQAPGLVAAARDFDAYSGRVAELTVNVTRLYGTVTALPVPPEADAVRVLWVSDIHNNPQAFDVMAELVEQFQVSAVFDTGDITDLGSEVEARQLGRVARFGVPYVWVRGNHDSRRYTQAFLERLPGVVVLSDAEVAEVAGLRVAGTGDPLFRPNKEGDDERERNRAVLTQAGERLAERVRAEERPVHVALVHEPGMAGPLMGVVPLVLDGHVHERRSRSRDGTLELTQGSSGGAGLRALVGEDPEPLEMSVLHLRRGDGALLAVDEVTVGGVGTRAVTVQRRTVESYLDVEEEDDEEPSPTPSPFVGPPVPTASPVRSTVAG